MARWALISSESGEATAACATAVVARLSTLGVQAAGFVQRKGKDASGRRQYEVERLGRSERRLLAVEETPAATLEQSCSLVFRPDGFAATHAWLRDDGAQAGLWVIDGVGKLEAGGQGHAELLRQALRSLEKTVLLGARSSQLTYLVERFQLEEEALVASLELPAAADQLEAFVRELQAACRPPAR